MAQPLTVALPPNLELWDGCIIRVTAVSATTGADVSGVQVRNIDLEVERFEGELAYGPFMLVTGPKA